MRPMPCRAVLPALAFSASLLTACGTPPAAAPAAVDVYAAGDIADCREQPADAIGAAKTAALLAPLLQADPQARVITLGDNTYPVGALSEFTNCYGPSWGKFKAVTHPSPGNHEYGTPKAAGYFDYFGTVAGPERRGYYRYQLGPWQVYSLNSYLEPAQHAAQLAWLKQELAAHPSACAMAYWHHPLFSSGNYASPRMRDTWDILYDANVDLIVAGHDHLYERFVPQDGAGKRDAARGITQFVVGTGGAELLQLKELLPNSAAVQTMQFGVLKLNLHAGGFSWRFLPINPSVVQDSGEQACH